MVEQTDGRITFKCLEITQPIGTFYVGVLAAQDVFKISYPDVRRIQGERRDVETYLGIERPLNSRRVEELVRFVGNVDATFPTSILIAVSSEDAEYNSTTQEMSLRNAPTVAKILDGQHRIAGLEDFPDRFDLIVTMFVDMDIEDQAMTFAIINLEQTRVNKSLAYDLYDYTKHRSPQKTAHNIVRLLDSEKGSPFEGKIKILGTASEPGEIISQAQFVDALLVLISRNPAGERDLLKRGRQLPPPSVGDERALIFRNFFLEGKDANIARILWNYFGAVEEKWGEYWTTPRRGYVLNRTTGFRGLMLFLPHAYNHLKSSSEVPEQAQFSSLLQRVRLEGEDFTPDNYPTGASGPARLREHLLAQTGLG